MLYTGRLLKISFALILGAHLAGCTGPMTLVHEGKAAATLVLAKDAPATVLLAAEEFQNHLEKITGTRLPQATDEKEITGPVVLIGMSALTKKMGLRSKDFAQQEYLVQVEPRRLVLIGRDRQLPGPLTPRSNYPYKGFRPYDAIGSCYAVYHFLESRGVRWYLPTDIGTVIPKQATLTVPDGKVRRKPWTVHRSHNMSNKRTPVTLYAWDRDTHLDDTKGQIAPFRETVMWDLRMRVQGDPFAANHSHYHWLSQFNKTHPEYFAKGRTFGSHTQLCWTEPGVIEQTIQDADDFFNGKKVPGLGRAQGDFFAVVPMDTSSYCKCERCKTFHGPKTAKVDGFNCGQYSRYIWTLVNKVAQGVGTRQPDKFISALAYARYFEPPAGMKFEPNIAVMTCLQSDRWGYWPEARRYNEEVFGQWTKLIKNLYVWLYLNFPQHKKNDKFPALIPHEYARQMRLFRKAGVKGLFLELTSDLKGLDGKGRNHQHEFPDLLGRQANSVRLGAPLAQGRYVAQLLHGRQHRLDVLGSDAPIGAQHARNRHVRDVGDLGDVNDRDSHNVPCYN